MMQAILLVTAFLFAADLDSLRREYEAKKVEANRQRGGDRDKIIEKEVVPVLKKIAELRSSEAVAFLTRLVETEMADLAAAACGPLAGVGTAEAFDGLLKAAQNRPDRIKEAALGALSEGKAKLGDAQVARVAGLLEASQPEKVKVAAARVLGGQDSLPAARALLQALAEKAASEELALAVDTELARFKAQEVLDFFFKEALTGGAKAPRQLVALLRVAAVKKAKEAAEPAQKLLSHRSPEVAAAAVSALASLGFEGGKEEVLKILRQWRSNVEPALDLMVSLAESGSAEAGQILVAVSREFKGVLQIAAISLLGRTKTDAALDRVIEALEEKDLAVRTAAMRAIREFKEKRVIGPLIGVMEREDGRLRGEAYKYLVKITGQSMAPSAEDWRKWWSYAQKDFSFNPKEEGHTSVKGATYYGIEVFSKRICFIIDCSSSMLEEVTDPKTKTKAKRVDLAKKELTKTLKELQAGTMVNIISFNSNYQPMAKALTALTRAGLVKALKHVQGLKTGTGTNIYDTLSAALSDRNVDTIFLLSDGQPTRGRYTDPAAILREIRKQNVTRNVTINTIAIGIELDLMRRLAQENGGTYVFVRD